MAIDLSKVNISLQQFHDIASGKYNAGDIKLTSENSITKANNHVSLYMKWRYTGESIKADEVVAVKEALVKALQDNGFTNEQKINEIREKIGLEKVVGESDVALERRKIKPLSRAEVREIFNANAKEINACAKNVEGGVTVMTDEEVLTQKHHKELKDADLFAATRNSVNLENNAKYMAKMFAAERNLKGEDLKAMHRHYIDCVAAGKLDLLPPDFVEPINRFLVDEMRAMVWNGFEAPDADEAIKLVGPDRIKRKLTEILEKEGKLGQYDIANAIRSDIQTAVKLKEFCAVIEQQIKDDRFRWGQASAKDGEFFHANKSRIVTPSFLLELLDRGHNDEFKDRFGDIIDNAQRAGDITKELNKSQYNHDLKYVFGSRVTGRLIGKMDAEKTYTPEGVRNGIGKMLVGRFSDEHGNVRLTDSELNKISNKFAPVIKEKISDEDISEMRQKVVDGLDANPEPELFQKKFEDFVYGKIRNDVEKYIGKAEEQEAIFLDTAKIEFVNSVLTSDEPEVYDVDVMKTVADQCHKELDRELTMLRNANGVWLFSTLITNHVGKDSESGKFMAEKLNKFAELISSKLKAELSRNGKKVDEESKDFRKMVGTIYLMFNHVDREAMDALDAKKNFIYSAFKPGDKGLWLLDAMVRTSARLQPVANN